MKIRIRKRRLLSLGESTLMVHGFLFIVLMQFISTHLLSNNIPTEEIEVSEESGVATSSF
jgi:hypothetical protein